MTHAFNVTHTCFYLILNLKKETIEDEKDTENEDNSNCKSLIKETLFTDIDILSMIIACIGHDLDHPGLGNTYFSKSKEYRAQSVNDKSVLENYHLYVLMSLID